MVKKLLVGLVLAILVSASFAGYSRGGRSGFSAARSSSYSSARSGYARSTNSYRTYTAPSYRSHSTHTVINNHHYSHGGYGMGGGFFSGMLGGYIGGSLASHHQPVVVASGVGDGQGMLVEGGQSYVASSYNSAMNILGFLVSITVIFGILFIVWLCRSNCSHHRNRW